MLELIGVSKRFGDVTALETIDVCFQADRTYVLLGTSGCGKSTLLKISLGLVTPDSGRVILRGEQLTPDNVLRHRRDAGYVIQSGGLFPHLTAGENAAITARHLGWKPERIAERQQQLAELTRLPTDLLLRFPSQLSGGQQQRVGLMRALFLDPDILLLDEPLGALDPIIRYELQTDLRTIFRELDKTVLFVTHDLQEAAYFADEVLLMREGRVVQRGGIGDLIGQPADPFVTQFVQAQRPTPLDAIAQESRPEIEP